MINILSYVGMNLQSEVCLWCLLGLVRTIFDATLFKVNANLKQVWQMNMPGELSMPVQRALRTMVSGVMLVQCFTVYIYLAAYIVLLYPVFLEERPTLVLPWLLLAAVRKLLCELLCLALGLGTCLLLGPARPPCIKFVIVKFTSIIPVFYMWMLVFSYYHALKVAAAFKTFPAGLPPSEHNYGLELAVRRRRTKSLLGEEQLRKKLVASFYREGTPSTTNETYLRPALQTSSGLVNSTDTSIDEEGPEADVMKPSTTGWSDIGAYEDWFGSEVMIPRDTDRILEQIVLMLLRVGAYLKKEGKESIVDSQILNSALPASWHQRDNIDCAAINADDTDTPPHIGSSKGNIASYLREYPQIFMKKQTSGLSQTELTLASLKAVHSHVETNEGTTSKHRVKQNTPSATSCEAIASVEFGNVPSKRKITLPDTAPEDKTVKKLTLPSKAQPKRMAATEEKKIKLKLKPQRSSERQSEKIVREIINKIVGDLKKTKTSAGDYNNASSYSKNTNTNSNKDSMETLTNDNNLSNLTMSDENSKNHEKNKIPQLKETNNDEFMFGIISIVGESLIESKLLNSDKGASDITILNETNNEETGSRLFNHENKEQFREMDNKLDSNDYSTCTRCIMSNRASGQTILKENNNWESMFSQTLNVDNHEEVSNDGKILSAGTNSEISNSSRNKACRCCKSSKDYNSILNNNMKEINNNNLNLNENKDVPQKNANKKELSEHRIYKNNKNKELPLRILSSEDNFIGSLDKKELNKDSKRKMFIKTKDKNNEVENKNKELLLRIVSNDDKITDSLDVKVSNKDSTDNKISSEVQNKDSTDGKILNGVDSTKSTESNSDSNSIESVAKNSNTSKGKK